MFEIAKFFTDQKNYRDDILASDYCFFLLLGLRLKDLLIFFGIKPLVLLCFGFLSKMPRNTISEMKIKVAITAGPMLV